MWGGSQWGLAMVRHRRVYDPISEQFTGWRFDESRSSLSYSDLTFAKIAFSMSEIKVHPLRYNDDGQKESPEVVHLNRSDRTTRRHKMVTIKYVVDTKSLVFRS